MIYRAVQIHVTAVTQLSVDAYRGDEKQETVVAPWAIIRRPNPNDSREAFLEETVASLALSGNAYWRITRDNQGRVTALTVLNPLDVVPQVTTSGTVTGYAYAALQTPIPAAEVKHLKFLRVPGSAIGLGPIQASQREIRGALDLSNYSSNWFRDSGVPSGILKTDQHLNREDAQEAKERWTEDGAGGIKVLGNGLDYKPFYLSARDLQFIENQQFSTIQLARLFGVPASLMLAAVEGNSQTYSNVEQEWLAYYRFTLSKYVREIESAFSSLLPGSAVARFNYEALLRPDTKTRYEAHKLALDAGFMDIDEVREIEKLPKRSDPSARKEVTPND
jgi:HK97 family phage portal protein